MSGWRKRQVLDMAREAGGCDITSHGWTSWVGTQSTEFLERFAELVRNEEREACAKVCDEETSTESEGEWMGCAIYLAHNIRERWQV